MLKDALKKRIIPLVTVERTADAAEILDALEADGYGCVEITLRTDAGIGAIRACADRKNLTVGAGTVLSVDQCSRAIDAGARFIVSPGLSDAVAAVCSARRVPYYPGCVTPTEIMRALSFGITTVKFFPCDIYGGMKALRTLGAPFPQIRFIPTGGIDNNNAEEYLAWDKISAVGGSSFTADAVKKWTKR